MIGNGNVDDRVDQFAGADTDFFNMEKAPTRNFKLASHRIRRFSAIQISMLDCHLCGQHLGWTACSCCQTECESSFVH